MKGWKLEYNLTDVTLYKEERVNVGLNRTAIHERSTEEVIELQRD